MDIVIPLYTRYTPLDAVGPYEVLSRLPDARVVFAAHTKGEQRADRGSLALVADGAFDAIERADVLLVPGGPGARTAVDDAALVGFIRRIHATTTWTAAVCTGTFLLGAAGLLDGIKATTHWSRLEELAQYGAQPSSERVIFAGKIVTAAGVSAGIDMALALAARLVGDELAQAIQLGIEYDPQPPFDAGSLAKAPPAVVALARARVRR